MVRDTVSGAVVAGNALLFRDDDGLPFSPPTQLHTRIVEGRLGAPSFNGKMLYCLSRDKAPTQRKRTYAEQHWYVGDDVQRALYSKFPRDAVYAILSVLIDGKAWQDAAYDVGWSRTQFFQVMRGMKDFTLDGIDNEMTA